MYKKNNPPKVFVFIVIILIASIYTACSSSPLILPVESTPPNGSEDSAPTAAVSETASPTELPVEEEQADVVSTEQPIEESANDEPANDEPTDEEPTDEEPTDEEPTDDEPAEAPAEEPTEEIEPTQIPTEEPIEVEPTEQPTDEEVEEEVDADVQPSGIAASATDEFVRREGSTLLLGGEPFRFVGTNAFFLQPEVAYSKSEGVIETLDKAVGLGFNVIRMWGFNDKDSAIDPAAIQLEPGQFKEESLVALDQVIALAKERNLKLILPLVNNWQDYGGIPRYLEWCDCEAEHGDFYTNETMKGWYKDYMQMLLTRVNTVTGIAYRDEPTIMAWELGNELRNRGQDPAILVAWHQEMAAFIKEIDGNHLIADGGEGFDDAPDLYPGLTNNYPVRGSEGTSYRQIATIPEIDMLSYHLYPEHWDIDPALDGPIWIRIHESIAKEAGKVAYFGEFGVTSPDAERAALYQSWLNTALIEAESSGALVWNLVYDARPNSDGYNIYCPADTATCAVLQQ